jgi:hypothetical protein
MISPSFVHYKKLSVLNKIQKTKEYGDILSKLKKSVLYIEN